ncbi:FecR family protein [Croceivirga radicis]|uniref:FecR family protein n=1 Tax=Croceivirga radicis TaxID=1929488 RepID=UPI000255AD1A|nr:FecR domain-containing protein [Croceivirga radicis]
MANNKELSVSGLIKDTSFVNWAKGLNQNDIEYWNKWIVNNPDKIAIVTEAKDCIVGITFNTQELTASEIDTAWQDLEAKLTQQEQQQDSSSKTINWYILSGVAASIALLIVLYLNFTSTSITTYSTGIGETLVVNLTDGTRVQLNSNSKINFEKDNPRAIKLTGEAYFEVAKKLKTNAKFAVKTNDLLVEVFGTKFNVNAHRNKTSVTLDEGLVKLKLANGVTKSMLPGEHVSYSHSMDQTVKASSPKNIKEISSWKNGALEFNGVPLHKVAERIEDIYNVSVEFMDGEAPNQLLTGGLPINNLEICLKAISGATNTEIIKNDDTISIKLKP